MPLSKCNVNETNEPIIVFTTTEVGLQKWYGMHSAVLREMAAMNDVKHPSLGVTIFITMSISQSSVHVTNAWHFSMTTLTASETFSHTGT